MSEPTLSLAREFPPATPEDWREQVVRALRGGDPESLVSRTLDDIPLEPLYTRRQAVPGGGLPGRVPWLRGGRATGNLPAGWDVRQLHCHPDPEVAATQIAEDLERGVRSIWLRLDRRLSRGEDGPDGVVLLEAADLSRILSVCAAAGAPLVLDPGGDFQRVAELLLGAAEGAGAAVAFGADPLGAAVVGEHPDPAVALAAMGDLAPSLAERFGESRLLWASGLPWHDAGASDAQELAAAIATGIAYLRLLTEAGFEVAEAARRIGFRLAVDPEIFATAAKLRAARRLWAQVARHSGVEKIPPFLHAVTAPRVMSRRDPWTNVLRVTAAALGAAFGGAEAITTLPFDHAIGPPDRFSRRIARNTQLVLALESRVQHPIDPLGGSWFADRFADALAEKAWDLVREIEAAGGMAEALRRGFPQERVIATRERRLRDIALRRELQVGIGGFAHLEETPPPSPELDLEALRARVAAARAAGRLAPPPPGAPAIRILRPWRLAEPFERLRDLSDAFLAREGRRPAVLLLRLGRPAGSIAPATLAKNLFEAGGIAAIEAPPGGDSPDLGGFDPARTPFVVLCTGSLDAGDRATTLAHGLRDSGAKRVYLAGGEAEGFDAVLREEMDALALLEDAWRALGEMPG